MKDGWPDDRVYLVEMTGREIATVIGMKYEAKKVTIGLEAKPAKIFEHTEKILANRHTTENAAKNLRALAELLESIEPVVTSAIQMPQDAGNENSDDNE